MKGTVIDGRVPLWVETRQGNDLLAIVVHDIGGPTLDAMELRGRALLPHLRGHGRSAPVQGGTYVVADFAADIVRILRWIGEPVLLAGVGRSALIAAVAAAAEPTAIRALVLAPADADIPCTTDPAESRQRWINAVLERGEIKPAPTLVAPEPLHPVDRELIWTHVPRPVGWVGEPRGSWTVGAPTDLVMTAGSDLLDDVGRLVDAMRSPD